MRAREEEGGHIQQQQKKKAGVLSTLGVFKTGNKKYLHKVHAEKRGKKRLSG